MRKQENKNPSSAALTAFGVMFALAGAAVSAAAYMIADTITHPQKNDPTAEYSFTPYELDLPWENISFLSADKAHALRGWWIEHPQAKDIIIASSGFHGKRADLLGIGKYLYNHGHSLFLIDMFGHGVYRGNPVTLGYRETADFLGAVDYVAARAPYLKIGALGYSMGGAVAILSAARDKRIAAIVADSSFATHKDVVSHGLHTFFQFNSPIIDKPVLFVANKLLQIKAGYTFEKVAPIREVAHIAPRPILLIHGTADTISPFYHSEWLYAAAREPKEIWLVEGAPHCGGYFTERDTYCQKIHSFFSGALTQPDAAEQKEHNHAVD